MRSREVTQVQRTGSSHDAQTAALARIYMRALRRYRENQKAADRSQTGGCDGTTVQGDSANDLIVQE
jgi:hypothetical protein